MTLSITVLCLSLLCSWSVQVQGERIGSGGSFLRDVVKANTKRISKEQQLNDALLAQAVPLDEYRASLAAQGLYLPMDVDRTADKNRLLEENQGNIKYYYYNSNGDVQYYYQKQNQNNDDGQQEEEEQAYVDDYYVSDDSYLDFDGYSLKYAKCQPVQRFSSYAMEAGEYSPLVLNDIAILRLCPSYYCSNSRAFGCLYDYAEYAIEMTSYVRVMLRYKMDQSYQLCNWCQNCEAGLQQRQRRVGNNYNYYNNNDDAAAAQYYNGDDGANAAAGDDAAAAQGDDYYAAANDDANAAAGDDAAAAANDDANAAAGDDAYAADDDAYAAAQYPEGCEDYASYCLDEYGYAKCDEGYENNNVGDDGIAYMNAEDYLEIIACTQVNGGYFVRPRCDGYSDTISLGVYHDRFCTWYAGDQVDIEEFALGVDQSFFKEFSGAGCVDCSQSDNPPYFNSNSNMCNRIDMTGARCTLSLGTEIFASNNTNVSYYYDDAKDCTFIESLRTGTYDEEGQLYSDYSFGVSRMVTSTQKWLLSICLVVCVLMAIYSCYLHHAITNLLIKSLSHTDLLPPSRHPRKSISARRRSRSRSRRKPLNEEDDDDENFESKGGTDPP